MSQVRNLSLLMDFIKNNELEGAFDISIMQTGSSCLVRYDGWKDLDPSVRRRIKKLCGPFVGEGGPPQPTLVGNVALEELFIPVRIYGAMECTIVSTTHEEVLLQEWEIQNRRKQIADMQNELTAGTKIVAKHNFECAESKE